MKYVFFFLAFFPFVSHAYLELYDLPDAISYEGQVWTGKKRHFITDPAFGGTLPELYEVAGNEGEKLIWYNSLYIGSGKQRYGYLSNPYLNFLSYCRTAYYYTTNYDLNCSNSKNINWTNSSTPPTCKCSLEVLNQTNVDCLKYDYDTCSCSCDGVNNDYLNINGTYQCLPKCEDDKIRDTNGVCTDNSQSDFLTPPDYCKSLVGSYVIPYTHSFHDEKPIVGSELLLHYTNIYTNGFTNEDENITSFITTNDILALGWDINVHHHLSDTILFKGNGEYIKDINATEVNGYINIKDKDLLYIFNSNKKHIKTKHILSNTTLYEFFYTNNKLSSIQDPNSKTITINYTSDKPSSITTDTGQTTLINTSTNNTITSITYPNEQTYTFTYDTNGLLKTKQTPKGDMYKYNYNTSNGYISSAITPNKGFKSYATTKNYNSNGNIIGFYENSKPISTTYKNYNASNGIKHSTVIDPNGYEKDVYINVNGKEKKTNSCNIQTVKQYNTIHPKTDKPLLTYLSYKMPSGLTHKSTFETSFINNVQTQKETTSNNITTTTTDFTNHTKTITSPLGFITTYTYDDKMLHLTQVKPPFSLPFTYTYDTRGNLIKQTRGEREINYTYDSYDNLITYSTNDFNAISYQYDNSNRLTNITYPDNSQVSYEYDKNNNVTTLFTPAQSPDNYSYNSIDKKTSHTNPSGYKTLYSYNRNGDLISITKPSLKSITYSYTNKNISSIYDGEYNTTITYTCNNLPKNITSTSNEEIYFMYDGDLLTSQEYKGVLNKTISYTYNDRFLPNSITYADKKESITYDKDGRITLIDNAYITYLENNQTLQENNFTSNTSLSNLDEIQSITNTHNNKPIYSYIITKRDKQGKILNATENINSNTIYYTYTYDNKSQLIKAKREQKDKIIIIPYDGLVIPITKTYPPHKETYTYDEAGNRISTTIKNATDTKTIDSTFINNSIQTYNDITYIYDKDGYLQTKITPDDTINYTYGIHGELKKVQSNNKTIEYLHNINHQRVAKKIDNEIVEKYLWEDLTTLLAIYDKNDNLITRYFYANNHTPYKIVHNNKTYYPNYNHQGSLISLIDINGNIVKEITYNPYGKILKDTNPSLNIHKTFANGLYDKDTNLIRFGKRDYDPMTGTWTAKDPIGYDGGDFNLYRYVLGDPVNGVDLEGMKYSKSLDKCISKCLLEYHASYLYLGSLAFTANLKTPKEYRKTKKICNPTGKGKSVFTTIDRRLSKYGGNTKVGIKIRRNKRTGRYGTLVIITSSLSTGYFLGALAVCSNSCR